VLLAALLGALLRGYQLGSNSLWIDELSTLSVASLAAADIVRLSSSVNFIPPLHFLVVHIAVVLFGDGEAVLRLPSAIAGACTIPIFWALTFELTSRRDTALAAAFLLAVSPLHIWFSQDARPYAMLLFFECCALLALARAVRSARSRDWLAFAAASALAFLTHTTALILVPVVAAWTWWSPDRSRAVRQLLGWTIVTAAVCAPFALAIASALRASQGQFHSPPRALTGLEAGYSLLTYVTGFSFGPAPREIQNEGAMAAARSHMEQTILAALTLGSVFVVIALRRTRAMLRPFALLAVPVAAMVALAAASGKAYNVRYTLPGLYGFLLLGAIGGTRPGPGLVRVSLGALLIIALWADIQWYSAPRYHKEDSRSAAAWLARQLPAGSAVAVAPGYNTDVLGYYARRSGARLRFLPIASGAGLPGRDTVQALALTRLHHVPNWLTLEAEFRRLAPIGKAEGRVEGYLLFTR
jgi:uncharacterized membrane protein